MFFIPYPDILNASAQQKTLDYLAVRDQTKLSFELYDLASQYAAFATAHPTAERSAFQTSTPEVPLYGGYVSVSAIASGNSNQLLQDLTNAGLINGAAFGQVVGGQLPVDALASIADLASMRTVRMSHARTSVGAVTSQADVAMQVDQARALFGVDGTGIDVGVLSDTYNALGGAASGVATGDLPAGVQVLQDLASGSDEGRAMLELVHDLAPGAGLLFHTAFISEANFAQGILDLAAAGADVIVDDVGYATEPFFQDGIVAQAVDQVAAQGVPYFSSAGNSARDSYESDFRNSGQTINLGGQDVGLAHDFDPGPGVDTMQQFTVPIGSFAVFAFQWDSPFASAGTVGGATNNVDFFIMDAAGTTILASGVNQNIGNDAFEFVVFVNDTDASSFNIIITSNGGPVPGHLKYLLWNGNPVINEYFTNSSTLFGHPNAAGAAGVGAAWYVDTPAFGTSPPELESFSSAGGTPIFFTPTGDPINEVRNKPDFTAVDGTDTTFFGFDADFNGFPNFFGTSAAAPHAAALAALVRQFAPNATPQEIYAGFRATAIDMGTPGFDFDTGAGLLDAVAALTLLDPNEPPVANPDNAFLLEDTTIVINVVANDTDTNGNLLPQSVVITVQPQFGTAVVDPATGRVSYTPSPNYSGADSFQYVVSDKRGAVSNAANVSIQVYGVNDPPFALDDVAITPVNAPVAINVRANDTDPDNPIATAQVIIVAGAKHGSVQIVAGNIVYTPDPNYVGGEAIQYRLRDTNNNLSNIATARVRVGNAVSIQGSVFHDANGDGVRNPGEPGIPNVAVTVHNADVALDQTLLTDDNGNYALSEPGDLSVLMPAGVYSIVETQPAAWVDGLDALGVLVGAPDPGFPKFSPTNDRFDIYVPAGVAANNFTFGERGIRVEFLTAYQTDRFFLATDAFGVMQLNGGGGFQNLNTAAGDVWYSFDGGVGGTLNAVATSNPALGGATISVYNAALQRLATSNTPGRAAVSYQGQPGQAVLVRVEGSNPDVDVQLTTTPVVLPTPKSLDAIGVFNPQTATFFLRDTATPGWPDIAPFNYGQPGWVAISGDWDGDGSETVGLYHSATATFYLRNANERGVADVPAFNYGASGWVPLAGDWDGDGIDTVGVYDPTTASFYLRNSNDSGLTDVAAFRFGAPGFVPVVGDWNNDQVDTIGVYDPRTAVFYIRNSNDAGGLDTPAFAFGAPGWMPVSGDFNGDGFDTIGVFNPNTAQFYLRNANTWGGSDVPVFAYGAPGWQPVIGHWQAVVEAGGNSLDTKVVKAEWAPTLTAAEVPAIISEAVARWAAAGISPTVASKFGNVSLQIADLPGTQLARTVGDRIYIDLNAAGHGWFVDSTPGADEEFLATAAGLAANSPWASGKLDLLSVLAHELGHVAGLDDLGPLADDIMADRILPGVRRLPTVGAVERIFARR
ncbi:MAG: tandem-95 repeat protein [Pirellulales bacterium]|nr:tandem-95 repeat protein [Pirellulales bacterium]